MEPYTSLIISAVVVAFLSALMIAASRGKPTADAETGSLVFRHNILLRGFSVLAAFGIPIGLTALVISKPPKDQGDYTAIFLLYAGFAAVSAPLLWESMRFSMMVGSEGLDCRSPWRGRQFIRWEEIEDVSYNAILGYFVIRAADGRKFRVSGLVTGLNSFLEVCEQRLTLDKLRRAKGGYNMLGRPFPEKKTRT